LKDRFDGKDITLTTALQSTTSDNSITEMQFPADPIMDENLFLADDASLLLKAFVLPKGVHWPSIQQTNTPLTNVLFVRNVTSQLAMIDKRYVCETTSVMRHTKVNSRETFAFSSLHDIHGLHQQQIQQHSLVNS
jgi:hypothetical protein